MARVLVVDDALMVRKMIGKMLENDGHVVVDEAVDGKQAIEMYQKHMPDIITLDITMPGMDGIEALTHIMEYDKEAKVIMVSALGQQHKVLEALEHGAKSYILKPVTAPKLLAVINRILDSGHTGGAAKPLFEYGEGRHQKSCDHILSSKKEPLI